MTCPVEIGQCYCNARVRIWHEAADRGSVTSRQILRVEQTCHGRRGTAESDPLRTCAPRRLTIGKADYSRLDLMSRAEMARGATTGRELIREELPQILPIQTPFAKRRA